jgi:hypothetical protein
MAHTIDLLESFALLESYGITVARSAYADSAESAVVFANRRPISMYALRPDGHGYDLSNGHVGIDDDDAIRNAYHSLTAKAGPRVFVQADVGPGSGIRLAGDEHDGKKHIRLFSGSHEVDRVCPLSEDIAEEMLQGLRSRKSIASSGQALRMLAHLCVRASKMYEESGIQDFVLWIRVHDNGYKVVDAKMSTERIPEIAHRLGKHGHDRWSYDYHPAGRPSLEPHTRNRK